MDGASEDVMRRFAQAIIDGDMAVAHGLLAPWLQRALTPADLAAVLERGRLDGAPAPARIGELGTTSAVDYAALTEVTGPQASLAEYARGAPIDPEVGMEGPPSFALDPALDESNFHCWGGLDLAPGEDDDSGLDYVLRLSLALAQVDGALRIGHVEPELV